MTLVELKAAYYDTMAQIEQLQQQAVQLNQMIAEKTKHEFQTAQDS